MGGWGTQPGGAPSAPGLFRLCQISRRHSMTALSEYVRSCKGKGTNCQSALWEGHVITGLPFTAGEGWAHRQAFGRHLYFPALKDFRNM